MSSKQIEYAVEMQGISKYFGGFCALNEVQLKVKKGTIHALLGENGAGKSTLMNILYGLYQYDSGSIAINGETTQFKGPSDAIAKGIGMVHQHFMLVENFTVAQNMILGSEITKSMGVIDEKEVIKRINTISEQYGLYIDPLQKIEDISVGMQQRVEILKALFRGVDILILDEPTAVLTPQEITELIAIMQKLIDDGKTIIIITHKLKEIKQSAHECTIIRRGNFIDTVDVSQTDEIGLAEMMVGRQVDLHIEKEKAKPGDIIFSIENLVVKDSRGINKVNDLSLQVRKGEILGIAGIDGNGQTELVNAIMNLVPASSGKIIMEGKEIQNTLPKTTISSKISTIPEDRHKHGLVLDFTVAENAGMSKFKQEPLSKNGILNLKEFQKYATKLIEEFDIRPADSQNLKSRALSGGNQQKIIIGREVSNNPDLLIAVQPTRGLDVGAIEFVHQSLVAQRDQGKAVLLVSLELDEVLDVSDRIAVIYDGKIVDIIDGEDADENTIGLLMAGGSKGE